MAAMTEALSWYRDEVDQLRARLAPYLPMPKQITVAIDRREYPRRGNIIAYALTSFDSIILRSSSVVHEYATPPVLHWPALRGVLAHELVHLTRHGGRYHGREFYAAALVAARVLGLPPPADPLEVDKRHRTHPRSWPIGQLDPHNMLTIGLARQAILPSPSSGANCAAPRHKSIAPRLRPCRDTSAMVLWVATTALMDAIGQDSP